MTQLSQNQNLFLATLQACGLTQREGHYALTSLSIHEFSSGITRELSRGLYQKEEFTEAFQSHIEDRRRLKQCLEPLITNYGHDDSLVRILLNIPIIQTPIMKILLDAILENESDVVSEQEYKERIPLVILDQFQYLYIIVNGQEICDKINELLIALSDLDVKRAILQKIPDIFNNEEDSQIMGSYITGYACSEQDSEDGSLLLAALDSLSHLQILHQDVDRVINHINNYILESIEIESLPKVLQFLIHHLSVTKNPRGVINEIREHFCIENLQLAKRDSIADEIEFDIFDVKPKDHVNATKMCIDDFYNDLRGRKNVQRLFFQTLQELSTFKILDLWTLIMFYSFPQYDRRAITLLKKKIIEGVITEPLISSALSVPHDILLPHVNSILEIANTLLKSSKPKYWLIGSGLYKNAFLTFSLQDRRVAQELFRYFISHLSSQNNNERDIVLQLLKEIANELSGNIIGFNSFFQGTLDYIRLLNEKQVRLFYEVTANISSRSTNDSEDIRNQFTLIIRKQLFNPNIIFKKIGTIGLTAIISSNLKHASNSNVNELVDLFHHALLGCKRSSEYYVLLDELSHLVRNNLPIPEIFSEAIRPSLEKLIAKFPIVSPKPQLQSFPENYRLLLDEDEIFSTINIFPTVVSEHLMTSSEILTSIVLHGLFSALYPDDRAFGSIMLSYPVVAPPEECVDAMNAMSKKEKDDICFAYLSICNWYREMLNVYCTSKHFHDENYRALALGILDQLARIEVQFEKALTQNPNFRIPKDCEGISVQISESRCTSKIRSPRKLRINLQDSKSKYAAYIRELDISVTKILSCYSTEGIGKSSFGWMYLLIDIHKKFQAIIHIPNNSKGDLCTFNFKPTDFFKNVISMVHVFSSRLQQFLVTLQDSMEELSDMYTGIKDQDTELYVILGILQNIFSYLDNIATQDESEECESILSTYTGAVSGRNGIHSYLHFLGSLREYFLEGSKACIPWMKLLELVLNVGKIEDSIISEIAEELMKSRSLIEKDNISFLVKCYLRYSSSFVSSGALLSDELIKAMDSKDEMLFNRIDSRNAPLFFVGLLQEMANYFKTLQFKDNLESIIFNLQNIEALVVIFKTHSEKVHQSSTNEKLFQSIILKYCNVILRSFNKNCFQFMEAIIYSNEENLEDSRESVNRIINYVNEAIQEIHQIILENKSKKSSILRYNAEIRKEMERFRGYAKSLFSRSEFKIKSRLGETLGTYEDLMISDSESDSSSDLISETESGSVDTDKFEENEMTEKINDMEEISNDSLEHDTSHLKNSSATLILNKDSLVDINKNNINNGFDPLHDPFLSFIPRPSQNKNVQPVEESMDIAMESIFDNDNESSDADDVMED